MRNARHVAPLSSVSFVCWRFYSQTSYAYGCIIVSHANNVAQSFGLYSTPAQTHTHTCGTTVVAAPLQYCGQNYAQSAREITIVLFRQSSASTCAHTYTAHSRAQPNTHRKSPTQFVRTQHMTWDWFGGSAMQKKEENALVLLSDLPRIVVLHMNRHNYRELYKLHQTHTILLHSAVIPELCCRIYFVVALTWRCTSYSTGD